MGAILGKQSIDNESFHKLDIRDLYNTIQTDDDIETAIKALLAIMTQQEKLGQLRQLYNADATLSDNFKK
jgi:hypothetical protein